MRPMWLVGSGSLWVLLLLSASSRLPVVRRTQQPGPAGDTEQESTALGARLFFDPILSADRAVACASCHDPAKGFADSRRFSAGVRGQLATRNTPTLLNRALGSSFMWDGRAASLEEQALLPIENPLEMALPLAEALARLADDPGYRAGFQQAFSRPPDRDGLARALASYVRSLVLGQSTVDRFRAGDFAALADDERAGLWFYESRGGCWRCHSGSNFSDEEFHDTGIGALDGRPEEGRFAVTGREQDRGRFKTPTLRGLLRTAPYMHDGSLSSLEEVIAFYRAGGRANSNLDPLVQPIEMSDADAQHLLALLLALSREAEPAAPAR